MDILAKENLVGAKTAPTPIFQDFRSLSKENQVSLVRTFLSDPVPKVKPAGLEVGDEKMMKSLSGILRQRVKKRKHR